MNAEKATSSTEPSSPEEACLSSDDSSFESFTLKDSSSSSMAYLTPSEHSDAENAVSVDELLSRRTNSNDFKLINFKETPKGSDAFIQAMLSDAMKEEKDDIERSNIVCNYCFDSALKALEDEIKTTEEDFIDYCKCLAKLETEAVDQTALKSLEKELKYLKNEQSSLLNEINTTQQENCVISKQIEELNEEMENLNNVGEIYNKKYSGSFRKVFEIDDECISMEHQLNYVETRLKRLGKKDVFQETFSIWHTNHFGTINNFRLGRLPSLPVSWTEINIALGQAALLLSALARASNITFETYKLSPFGNHSFIEIEPKGEIVPLYGVGGSKYVWNSKIDDALKIFLRCLNQLGSHFRKEGMHLPYIIENDRIGHSGMAMLYSVRAKFNSEEEWTKALKFMLTNLRWCTTFVSDKLNKNNN